MGKLLYITHTSLDGYIEDAAGTFDFAQPGGGIFEFITEMIRPFKTHLYGRKLYETMAYWEAPPENSEAADFEFARIWQGAEKIVFSRAARPFDAAEIAKLKRESPHDMIVGGAELAGVAIGAGLVDECRLFVNPIIVGGGKPAFRAGLRRDLELLETRGFDNGVVYLRYALRAD